MYTDVNHLTCISLLRKPGKSGIGQDDWPFACLQSAAVCDWQALLWARWMPSPNRNGGEPAAAILEASGVLVLFFSRCSPGWPEIPRVNQSGLGLLELPAPVC